MEERIAQAIFGVALENLDRIYKIDWICLFSLSSKTKLRDRNLPPAEVQFIGAEGCLA